MNKPRSTWKLISGRAALAAIGVTSLVVTTAALPVTPAKEAASRWAGTLSIESVRELRTAASLRGLPPEYRRALYDRSGSAAEKADFWRGLFAEFRSTHRLAPDQAALLTRAEAFLVPRTFEGRATPALQQEIIEVAQAIQDSLGRDAVKHLFYASGPVSKSSGLQLTEQLKYSWRNGALRNATRWVVPTLFASMHCNCAVGAGDNGSNCGYEMHCGWNEEHCPMSEWTTWGCGPWWMSPCNGTCSYAIPS